MHPYHHTTSAPDTAIVSLHARCVEDAATLGMTVALRGDHFILQHRGSHFGAFPTVAALRHFLDGFLAANLEGFRNYNPDSTP